MKKLILTKHIYDFIDNEIRLFNEKTNDEYHMDFQEVLFSFLHSTDETHYVLNDWDEGKDNDTYWNEDKNKHCCEVFLEEINIKITEIEKL
jgi:hypothetical protein